jgi:hypothetical protein
VQLFAAAGGSPIMAPSSSTEIRGAPAAPIFALNQQTQSDESLAIIANLCFSGDGDVPLCLLFEPR